MFWSPWQHARQTRKINIQEILQASAGKLSIRALRKRNEGYRDFRGTNVLYKRSNSINNYSKTKTNWQLWAGHWQLWAGHWQLRAELKPSSTMPNFHIRAVFFVMDSIILHIILKVNKLNLFHSNTISIVLVFDICSFLMPRPQLPVCFGFSI